MAKRVRSPNILAKFENQHKDLVRFGMELKANNSPLKSLITRLTVFQGILGSNADARKRVGHALGILKKQIFSKETAEMIRQQSSKAQVEAAESELAEIKEIIQSRKNTYRDADYIIETDNQSPNEISSQIKEEYLKQFGKS